VSPPAEAEEEEEEEEGEEEERIEERFGATREADGGTRCGGGSSRAKRGAPASSVVTECGARSEARAEAGKEAAGDVNSDKFGSIIFYYYFLLYSVITKYKQYYRAV
jgi:hypothetical protein